MDASRIAYRQVLHIHFNNCCWLQQLLYAFYFLQLGYGIGICFLLSVACGA
jgi:hypothetical protein